MHHSDNQPQDHQVEQVSHSDTWNQQKRPKYRHDDQEQEQSYIYNGDQMNNASRQNTTMSLADSIIQRWSVVPPLPENQTAFQLHSNTVTTPQNDARSDGQQRSKKEKKENEDKKKHKKKKKKKDKKKEVKRHPDGNISQTQCK